MSHRAAAWLAWSLCAAALALFDRICGVFGCSHEEYLSIYQEVA